MKKSLKKLFAVSALSIMAMSALTGCGGGVADGDMPISIMSREDGSGTRGAFVELVGILEEVDGEDVDMTTVNAQITNSTSVMMTSIAGDEYGIGYISLGSLNDTVKALKVDGVEATTENIISGDYTLARPFNLAVKEGNDNPIVADFMAYIMSPEGQKIAETTGFVPMNDTKEYKASDVSGKIVVGGSTSVTPLMEKLVEAYNVINKNVEIEIQATGSSTGMESAINGTYDIGMASRNIKDSELSKGLVGTVCAMDGIAVVVNTANELEDITAAQIKDIYVENVLTWSELAQ